MLEEIKNFVKNKPYKAVYVREASTEKDEKDVEILYVENCSDDEFYDLIAFLDSKNYDICLLDNKYPLNPSTKHLIDTQGEVLNGR